MPWRPALNQLRDALAERHPTEVRARRIIAAARSAFCPISLCLAVL